MEERDSRRSASSFDRVAELYDRYRDAHPPEVLAALAAGCGLRTGSRVLEIGCGTGQLSVPLAQMGVSLLAVEMGAALAAIARRHLRAFPAARVEVARFEDWPRPLERFDAVVCANAYHWLEPGLRTQKALQALRPGGVLGIVHPHHVAGGTPGFSEDANAIYVRYGLGTDLHFTPPRAEDLPPIYPEVDGRGEVRRVERRRAAVTRRYATGAYIGMLRTDSLVLGVGEAAREGFLRDLAQLIERRYGGVVERRFLYETLLAVRA